MIKEYNFTLAEATKYHRHMPSKLVPVEQMVMTPIDELEIDLLLEIQMSVEADSHLKNVDYTMLEPEEVAEIVHDYVDML